MTQASNSKPTQGNAPEDCRTVERFQSTLFPVIHIGQLAKALGLERRWILDHWINRESTGDSIGPVPHFRDGHHVFFPLNALEQWAESRATGATSQPATSVGTSRGVSIP